jgi:uncharacterized protein
MMKNKYTFAIIALCFQVLQLHSMDADEPETEAILFNAISDNSIEDVQYAINAGANVNWQYKNKVTALMWAISHNRTDRVQNIVSMLIDAGADLNMQDDKERTALMWAISYNNQLDIVTILIDSGADLNIQDHQGQTALMWAATKGIYALENFLITIINTDRLQDLNANELQQMHNLFYNMQNRTERQDNIATALEYALYPGRANLY